jgi:hypothetical protein
MLQKHILDTGEITMHKMIGCNTIWLLSGFLYLCPSSGAYAADKVVIIPMASAKPLKNIVTVAKAYGNFTDPVVAVNSITDASATNPYLVLIAPGTYTLTTSLVMKPYVDISGSGENVTKLTGAISSATAETSMTVKGANHTTLSNLSISNTGGNGYSIGIYTTGLDISARLQQVLATATGGDENISVLNDHSSPIMTGVNIIAGGTAAANIGVYNYTYSSPIMTEVNTVVSGAADVNYGVLNYNHSSPTMTEVHTAASGGTTNYGVENALTSSPAIRRSSIAGATDGLHNNGATSTISQSTILNGVSGGGATCIACDNGAGHVLPEDCTP